MSRQRTQKNSARRIVFIAFALATVSVNGFSQALPEAAPESLGISSERLNRVDALFESYIAEGRIAGVVVAIARNGKLAHLRTLGRMEMTKSEPMREDAIFRMASMTKPITSTAVMMLYEEGHFLLDDPISKWLPEYANKTVRRTGGVQTVSEPAARPITVRHVLSHTSGLSIRPRTPPRGGQEQTRPSTLAEAVDRAADVPLAFHPGDEWQYGASTDYVAILVEKISGMSLDDFLRERIFEPLGMVDTGFYVPSSKRDRLSRLYGHVGRERTLTLGDTTGYTEAVTMFSGGGGLVGTAADYMRFAQMLLNGGELDGTRILGRATIDLMTVDHLGDAPTGWLSPGWGFGLGFTVRNEAGRDGTPGSVGEYYWFGVAGTSFWVDPAEELIGVFMVQMRPSRDLAYRQQFKNLVYQALIG